MAKTQISLLLGIVVILSLSGCTDACLFTVCEEPGWSMSIAGHDKQKDKSYRFSGEVRLGGQFNDLEMNGVRVEFCDSSTNHLDTIHIGSMNATKATENVTATFDHPPKYVLVKVGSINDRTKDRDRSILGLERADDGEYYPFGEYDAFKSEKCEI